MTQSATFIVSTGRTGTVAIARACALANPACRALHEPYFPRMTRLLGSLYQRERIPAIVPTEFLRILRIRAVLSQRNHIESNPMLARLIPPLATVFPDLNLVHVVREPVSYIHSVQRFGTFHGWKKWAMNIAPALAPEVARHDFQRQFGIDTPVLRAACYWKSLNELIRVDSVKMGLNYFLLRYEDLFSGDDSSLRTLSILCDGSEDVLRTILRGPPINASKPDSESVEEAWTTREWEIVLEMCAEEATRYNYSLESQ